MVLRVLTKYNPYHDELGRFTSRHLARNFSALTIGDYAEPKSPKDAANAIFSLMKKGDPYLLDDDEANKLASKLASYSKYVIGLTDDQKSEMSNELVALIGFSRDKLSNQDAPVDSVYKTLMNYGYSIGLTGFSGDSLTRFGLSSDRMFPELEGVFKSALRAGYIRGGHAEFKTPLEDSPDSYWAERQPLIRTTLGSLKVRGKVKYEDISLSIISNPGTPKNAKFVRGPELDAIIHGAEGPTGYNANLTHGELSSISRYTSNEHSPINKYLATVHVKHAPSEDMDYLKRSIRNLDSAINKAKIPTDLVVSRVMRDDVFYNGIGVGLEDSVGAVYKEKAYSSASLSTVGNYQMFSSESKPLRLVVRVPEGSTGRYVESTTSNKGEYEVIMPRNSMYRVTGYFKSPMETIVSVDYLGYEDD